MSLTARLHIDQHPHYEKGIRILSYDFSFSQEIDHNGLASSRVRAGLITLTITGINDTELVNWMLNRWDRKKGKISFFGINESGVPQESKSLKFEDAFLVHYGESFTDQSDMIINLSISCRKITLSNADWETEWDMDENT